MFFLGYPENHPKDIFRVFDLVSEKPIITRDIKWLNKSYGEFFNKKGSINLEDTELESSDEEIEVEFSKVVQSKVQKQKTDDKKPINFGLERKAKVKIEDESNLLTHDENKVIEPNIFKEAWYSEDPGEKHKWQEAISKELNCMKELKVWEKMDKSEDLEGRKPIGSKWVFKLKRDGQFRARLVALGYNQIPGIDFLKIIHQ